MRVTQSDPFNSATAFCERDKRRVEPCFHVVYFAADNSSTTFKPLVAARVDGQNSIWPIEEVDATPPITSLDNF